MVRRGPWWWRWRWWWEGLYVCVCSPAEASEHLCRSGLWGRPDTRCQCDLCGSLQAAGTIGPKNMQSWEYILYMMLLPVHTHTGQQQDATFWRGMGLFYCCWLFGEDSDLASILCLRMQRLQTDPPFSGESMTHQCTPPLLVGWSSCVWSIWYYVSYSDCVK